MRRFRAPGRVNLIGEHTDYSGGLVLPAAIDRAIVVEAELGGDRIQLTSEGLAQSVDVPADGSQAPARGWGRYVAAVAAELAAAGRPPVGLRGHVRSDLPRGAGLSSSAALEVAVGVALCAAAGTNLEPMALAGLAQRAEMRAVGVPCGIMDQAASVLGRPDHAVLLDCGTGAHRHVPLPSRLAMLIVDSGVPRRLEESGYAQRRAELEQGLDALAARPADIAVDDLPALTSQLPPLVRRRVRHVVTENERVRQVVELLTCPGGGDLARLGQLFAEGHASLRDDFEVSTVELDTLVELARGHGAVAARMTGGGFGGAIVVLAEREAADDLGAAISDGYAQGGGRATVHACRAAAGAGEL